jgi:hypothetical protein
MTRTGQRRAQHAAHRLSAFLVALLWCAAPVLSVLHASAEAHRFCAEHGVLEDAGREETDDTPAERGPVAAGQSDPSTSHEGCAFARFCRFGQVLAQLVLEPAGELEHRLAVPPTLVIAPARVAIILIAPKTSPPV